MAEKSQVSGKVFRFLSAMHPALSKAERKRYAGYDPDKWYDWSPEVAAEFTDLMRRSPRDTSFARSFAYAAQRSVPEGHYVPTRQLLEYIGGLPAAFRGGEGSGFHATLDRPGHAIVSYTGFPGFSNVCIAIQGELTQRLQATGAQAVNVRHAEMCRVSGAGECRFEVEWTAESPPAEARPVDARDLVGEGFVVNGDRPAATEPSQPAAVAAAPAPAAASPRAASGGRHSQAARAAAGAGVAAAQAAEPVAPRAHTENGASGELESQTDDLFVQLRKRLAEADRQSRLYADAQAQIDSMRLEMARVRAQAETDVAKAQKERDEAREALTELKRRVRAVIADD
jgi:hypothetical protein